MKSTIRLPSLLVGALIACAHTETLVVKWDDPKIVRACQDQRAEVARFLLANAGTCSTDSDCVRLPFYEAGNCEGWVTESEAAKLDQTALARVEQSCAKVIELPLTVCPASAPRCTAGRCTGEIVVGAGEPSTQERATRDRLPGDEPPREEHKGCEAMESVKLMNDFGVVGTPFLLTFVVGADGTPHCFSIVAQGNAPSPSRELKGLVIEGVRRCRWIPGRRKGMPTAMTWTTSAAFYWHK